MPKDNATVYLNLIFFIGEEHEKQRKKFLVEPKGSNGFICCSVTAVNCFVLCLRNIFLLVKSDGRGLTQTQRVNSAISGERGGGIKEANDTHSRTQTKLGVN